MHTYTPYEPQPVQAPLTVGKLHSLTADECIFSFMCLFFENH